jgi:hypothetical protein
MKKIKATKHYKAIVQIMANACRLAKKSCRLMQRRGYSKYHDCHRQTVRLIFTLYSLKRLAF